MRRLCAAWNPQALFHIPHSVLVHEQCLVAGRTTRLRRFTSPVVRDLVGRGGGRVS